jgi:hypothetical protein
MINHFTWSVTMCQISIAARSKDNAMFYNPIVAQLKKAFYRIQFTQFIDETTSMILRLRDEAYIFSKFVIGSFIEVPTSTSLSKPQPLAFFNISKNKCDHIG